MPVLEENQDLVSNRPPGPRVPVRAAAISWIRLLSALPPLWSMTRQHGDAVDVG